MGYEFMTVEHRAVCINVVEGDSWDLLLDRGFHDYKLIRLKLNNYEAYEIRKSTPEEREAGKDAKQACIKWLKPIGVQKIFDISSWPLRVRTHQDPRDLNRWFADLWFKNESGNEVHVGDALVAAGLAVKMNVKKS